MLGVPHVLFHMKQLHGYDLGFRGSGDDIMTSQVPRPKVQLDPNSFLISGAYKTIISSQTFLRKNAPKDLK